MPAHNIPVSLVCFDDSEVEVPLVVLATWAAALKLEKAGILMKGRKVSAVVRKTLKGKKSWSLEDMAAHIEKCKNDALSQLEKIHEQLKSENTKRSEQDPNAVVH